MQKFNVFLSTVLLILVMAVSAEADLFDRGSGLIYDSFLDITWLQNANYSDHTMIWADAVEWADNLIFADYSDWRLPISDTCSGKDCSGSEMGHLFYEDGISSETAGLFSNVKSYYYWSVTEDADNPAKAWRFNFKTDTGTQGTSSKTLTRYAWAVRNGDVTSPVAPEPLSSLLFITGGAVMVIRRKIKKKI